MGSAENQFGAGSGGGGGYLLRYGQNYALRPEDAYGDEGFATDLPVAQFSLPPLDHPATPGDVRAGRALFSLTGKTRVWPMPKRPFGDAWQAEEVFVDGKWKRFFGVLGKGEPRKVPAEEFEIPDYSSPWVALSGGFDILLMGPGEKSKAPVPVAMILKGGAPAVITLSVRNRRGIEQAIPGSLLLPASTGKALPAALQLALDYSEKFTVDDEFGFIWAPLPKAVAWQSVPLRTEVLLAPRQADGAVLAPAGEFIFLTIDLRDYFDLTRPGLYRMKIGFHDPTGTMPDNNAMQFRIR